MLNDFLYALRTLRRSPGFALVAVGVLALGIGANAALFRTLDAAVLRALPFPQPRQLASLSTSSLISGVSFATSWPDFQDWSQQNHAFTALAAYASGPGNLTGVADPAPIEETAATRGFFQILGARAVLGRTFSSSPRTAEAVISSGLWRREFGGQENVLGRQIQVDDTALTVVGVLGPGGGLPNDSDVWIPADLDPDTGTRSAHNWPGVVGRLRPGVSLAAAQAEMTGIGQRLARLYPDSNRGEGIAVVSLQDALLGPTGFLLWLLLGAAGLVLLIACANLANLYLVRATGRQREAALRLALGATRWRLARQWLAEGVLIAAAGGVIGLWVAGAVSGFLSALVPVALPGTAPAGMSLTIRFTMAGFAFGLALLSAALFAAAPALQALPLRIVEQLKQGGAQAGDGRGHRRTRQALAVGELALAMVVLAGAGVLLRSLQRMQSLDLGFQPEHRAVAEVSLTTNAQAQWGAILDRLRANPSLRRVGAATSLPFTRFDPDGAFEIAGRAAKPAPYAAYRVASPGYFAAMGIPLLQGRDFTAQDNAHAPGAAVIDLATARLYFPGENPLGQRLRFDGFDQTPQWLTVVGVVGDVQHGGLRARPEQEIYASALQHTDALYAMGIVAVGAGNVGASLRAAVRQVNPELPVTLTSMDALVASATAAPRLRTTLLSAFAGLAWLLAALGVYGVLAQEVARRRRELGIRIGLGASPGQVERMILRQSLGLGLVGIGAGLALALAATRLLQGFLFETAAGDPRVLGLGALALAATAALAGFWPARRASRVDPIECLRAE